MILYFIPITGYQLSLTNLVAIPVTTDIPIKKLKWTMLSDSHQIFKKYLVMIEWKWAACETLYITEVYLYFILLFLYRMSTW